MGRIMLATSASTDEEYGGTFVARADEIEPALVLSIPANTYNTWALALNALETAFNSLSDENKLKTIIKRGNIIYHLSTIATTQIHFVSTYGILNAGNVAVQDIDIKEHKFCVITIASGGNTNNDYSSSAQDAQIDLYVI